MLVKVLGAITWAHTLPPLILVLAIMFRNPVSQKLAQVTGIKKEGNKYEIAFDLANERDSRSLPVSGDTVLRPEDVRSAFSSIAGLEPAEIERYLDTAHGRLIRAGIVTRAQLDSFVSSPALESLRRLYVTELGRDSAHPLDPIAIAAWGPILFSYGNSPDVIEAVRSRLRQSPEYRRRIAQ